jgi:hypothetical protein
MSSLAIRALLLLAVVAAIAGVGFRAGYTWRDDEVAGLHRELGEHRAAYAHLAAVSARQNAAVQDLEAKAAAARAQARQALEHAQALSQDLEADRRRLAALIASPDAAGRTAADAVLEVRAGLR